MNTFICECERQWNAIQCGRSHIVLSLHFAPYTPYLDVLKSHFCVPLFNMLSYFLYEALNPIEWNGKNCRNSENNSVSLKMNLFLFIDLWLLKIVSNVLPFLNLKSKKKVGKEENFVYSMSCTLRRRYHERSISTKCVCVCGNNERMRLVSQLWMWRDWRTNGTKRNACTRRNTCCWWLHS